MYSEQDLRDAVAGGAITEDAAQSLRAHVAQMRQMPITDEENFRLINSFNDIFVAIGVVIMLLAVGAIGQAIAGAVVPLPDYPGFVEATEEQWRAYQNADESRVFLTFVFGGGMVAATAWILAEFFTKRRRMALPSIILLLAFVGGLFFAVFGGAVMALTGGDMSGDPGERTIAIIAALGALTAAGGAFLHWKRFMVPITIAAGAAALAGTVIALLLAAIGPGTDNAETVLWSLVFVAGLAVFAFAMRWDISDRERKTRRADVAFWLHLLAAPMIAHPIFALIGVMDNDMLGVGSAIGVLAVYVVFGLVALAIDRRALLVSALIYVLIALTFLFDRFGAVELTFALTALVIGSALLTLSAFWTTIREKLVLALPGDVQARLPVVGPLAQPA
ncbi:hypothetical protein [Aurantiacibacter gangjinensis]|uniref:Uncharacterized protein n=1 Tax=Aurantiacibacter gangjinensis TaxID=502682 RepID=A0A0G9MRF0_9SPHN|nr:hypothetical protein [Aurantiacibacter gangjinensis]APE29253.1 hypothetical protein BMF35_a2424 [Aurantiacibacter gangjinensis]KLE33307.1 hypothetical protein AAW01_05000 [Aurantiacibacter gangjinensis]